MTCTAVIVTYRTPTDLLERCVESLGKSGITQHRIIDNTNHNRGFAAGANAGARGCATDTLLFINPDAALHPQAYQAAASYLDRHPRCGIVGFLLQSPAGEAESHSFGALVTPLSLITRHLLSSRIPRFPTEVGWVSGGALLIRRQLFEDIGGFDEQFFLYWEDVDLCRRSWAAGSRVALLPAAVVAHERGASLSDQALKTRFFDQSADKYFAKYYPKSICLVLRFARSLYRHFLPQVL